MRHETNRRHLYERRAFLVGGAQTLLLGSLAARLYYLQVMRGDEYQTLSDNNRIKVTLITPERGLILDRYGQPMASNDTNYRLYLEKRHIRMLDYSILASILAVDAKALETATKRRKPFNDAVLIAEHLTWEQVSAIHVRTPEMPGLFVEMGKVRFYPYKDITAHLLGYVGAPVETDGDLAYFRRLPELKVGKRGVEKAFEHTLCGSAGVKQEEVNATGLIVREISTQPGVKGADALITVDMELQQYLHERLAQEKSAAAAVMDVHTGEVYALSSHPAFDPNEFSKGISRTLWNNLLANPKAPLLNKAIAGQYPPGSTYKMLIGLAGLEAKKIDAHTTFFCPGHFDLGNHRFHCWKREGHGSVSIREAIQQSCDVYFYNVSMRTGQDKIASICRAFGMGTQTGIELPGELPGIVPDNAWKRKRFKQEWQTGDTVNASIGQGYVLATPLQLAAMVAQMVNGGKRLRPTLIKPAEPPPIKPIPVRPEHLALVVEGMDWVTNKGGGTAYGKRIWEEGMEMGGKTGTSQVRALSKIKTSREDAYWTQQHHALFVGFAPVHAPRFAMSIIVEHGGSGSGAAAPAAHDILLKTQQLFAAKEKPA